MRSGVEYHRWLLVYARKLAADGDKVQGSAWQIESGALMEAWGGGKLFAIDGDKVQGSVWQDVTGALSPVGGGGDVSRCRRGQGECHARE